MSDSRLLSNLLNKLEVLKENEEYEFKEAADAIPKSFWDTYSAFANTSGGFILLGISDSRAHRIIGVSNAEKIKRDLFNTANNPTKVSHCVLENDDVKEHEIDGKIIISVYVRELRLDQKPLYLHDNIAHSYIRKNEADCRASKEDIRRFIRNSSDDIDAELLDGYTLEDLNPNSILSFKSIMHKRKPDRQYMSMDDLHFLTEMSVFRVDRKDRRTLKLTLAGLLFLGKFDAITQKLPHFHLDYLNRRGETSTRWRDRVSTGDIDCPDMNLFEFYQTVREKLRYSVEDKFELDGRSVRKPSSELNTALREALANAIIHADYLDPETAIQVTVDNLYYTFLNPGKMRISETEFFLGGYSNPRNNMLIQYFRNMGESERAGTGGREIIGIASKNEYRMPDLYTDLKLTKLRIWSATPADSYDDLSEAAQKILRYIHKKTSATKSDIKKNCSLSDHYARKAIDELLRKKIIYVFGKGRAIRYCWSPSVLETLDFANRLSDSMRKIPSLKS